MNMLEFVKSHPVLYAKEHVHYVYRAKKDALWDQIGQQAGSQTLVPEPMHKIRQADCRLAKVRLR